MAEVIPWLVFAGPAGLLVVIWLWTLVYPGGHYGPPEDPRALARRQAEIERAHQHQEYHQRVEELRLSGQDTEAAAAEFARLYIAERQAQRRHEQSWGGK